MATEAAHSEALQRGAQERRKMALLVAQPHDARRRLPALRPLGNLGALGRIAARSVENRRLDDGKGGGRGVIGRPAGRPRVGQELKDGGRLRAHGVHRVAFDEEVLLPALRRRKTYVRSSQLRWKA